MNMCKMLVISDSHGYTDFARRAIKAEYPFDMLAHCGDVQREHWMQRGLIR